MIKDRTPIRFDVTINVWDGIVMHYKERYGKQWRKKLKQHTEKHLKELYEGEGLGEAVEHNVN